MKRYILYKRPQLFQIWFSSERLPRGEDPIEACLNLWEQIKVCWWMVREKERYQNNQPMILSRKCRDERWKQSLERIGRGCYVESGAFQKRKEVWSNMITCTLVTHFLGHSQLCMLASNVDHHPSGWTDEWGGKTCHVAGYNIIEGGNSATMRQPSAWVGWIQPCGCLRLALCRESMRTQHYSSSG